MTKSPETQITEQFSKLELTFITVWLKKHKSLDQPKLQNNWLEFRQKKQEEQGDKFNLQSCLAEFEKTLNKAKDQQTAKKPEAEKTEEVLKTVEDGVTEKKKYGTHKRKKIVKKIKETVTAATGNEPAPAKVSKPEPAPRSETNPQTVESVEFKNVTIEVGKKYKYGFIAGELVSEGKVTKIKVDQSGNPVGLELEVEDGEKEKIVYIDLKKQQAFEIKPLDEKSNEPESASKPDSAPKNPEPASVSSPETNPEAEPNFEAEKEKALKRAKRTINKYKDQEVEHKYGNQQTEGEFKAILNQIKVFVHILENNVSGHDKKQVLKGLQDKFMELLKIEDQMEIVEKDEMGDTKSGGQTFIIKGNNNQVGPVAGRDIKGTINMNNPEKSDIGQPSSTETIPSANLVENNNNPVENNDEDTEDENQSLIFEQLKEKYKIGSEITLPSGVKGTLEKFTKEGDKYFMTLLYPVGEGQKRQKFEVEFDEEGNIIKDTSVSEAEWNLDFYQDKEIEQGGIKGKIVKVEKGPDGDYLVTVEIGGENKKFQATIDQNGKIILGAEIVDPSVAANKLKINFELLNNPDKFKDFLNDQNKLANFVDQLGSVSLEDLLQGNVNPASKQDIVKRLKEAGMNVALATSLIDSIPGIYQEHLMAKARELQEEAEGVGEGLKSWWKKTKVRGMKLLKMLPGVL